MGLELVVGQLVDVRENDPEALPEMRLGFFALNKALRLKGLPKYQEPEEPREGLPWSGEMIGYGGLHTLRRVAVYLLEGRGLPAPLERGARATNDPLIKAYWAEKKYAAPTPPERLAVDHPLVNSFKHLLIHSDCTGYYVPVEFNFVQFPPEDVGVPGGQFGSSYRLIEECRALARAMGLPLDLDPWSDEVVEASEDPDPTAGGWKRFGVEAFTCLQLYRGCEQSIRHKAALVFA